MNKFINSFLKWINSKKISIKNSEFSCTTHGECSEENACINGICKNPCDASEFNPCLSGQACQVKNHQPVCIKGNWDVKFFVSRI